MNVFLAVGLIFVGLVILSMAHQAVGGLLAKYVTTGKDCLPTFHDYRDSSGRPEHFFDECTFYQCARKGCDGSYYRGADW